MAVTQKVEGLTPNPAPDPGWVELEHPGIEGTHRCPNTERSRKHWADRGWSPVKAEKAAPTGKEV